MENRVDNLERSLTEMKEVAHEQFEELRRLFLSRDNRRRGRSNTPRHRRTSRDASSVTARRSDFRSQPGSRYWSRAATHDREQHEPYHHRHHLRAVTGRRVDIPMFNGSDAYGWITKVERFFRLSRVEEREKIEMVMIAMEDRALSWFQWWEEQAQERAWEPFKQALIRRFQPDLVQNPFGPLLSAKQKGSVMEYREAFELLAAPMRNADREVLKGVFLNGLQEDIKAEMKLYPADDLAELMDRALLLEEKNSAMRGGKLRDDDKRGWKEKGGTGGRYFPSIGDNKGRFANSAANHQNRGGTGTAENEGKNLVNKGGTGSNEGKIPEKKWNGGQRLSQTELQERSRKGLCFKCGEKWGREHICAMRNYQLILVEGEEEEEEDEVFEEAEDGEFILEGKVLQLSMNSKEGLTSNRSFKVKGKIGSREVLILVDCGATSNFISQELVVELDIPVIATSEYIVEVGNGARERNSGVCNYLKLEVQGIPITQHFFILGLGGTEVVLGMDWLASLGNIRANFQKLTIQWEVQGQKMFLQGEPSWCKIAAGWKSIKKTMEKEGEAYYLSYEGLTEDTRIATKISEEIEGILAEFPEVFQEPKGLPPKRATDHAILLQEGASIPNSRPYRYPFYQKNEIEKLVKDMLKAGIIRPSTSPFSSPAILVKKKDGGWRFCVDYRALNKLTIPDKFPIPIIDELLDEIGAAVVFSKLDLKSGYHQIRMREEDIPKTAFRTHEGHYEYLVLPFGLSNAPSTFQALMNQVLKPYLRKFALVFFDDILIYSESEEKHREHLRKVLQALEDNHLVANQKKCSFGQLELVYLGHVISGQGVAADPNKIKDMLNWPTPKDVKGLRGFLGLTGYYRKFIIVNWPNLSTIYSKRTTSIGVKRQLRLLRI
ncbi:uncharacterized protein LOC130736966 [Lotus japonicus]|uniref:uncharacterized protein LOC130736966 n=1 Tax=Lotus japonicus TaxID=34305 RepID=UPI00258EADFA|nr:uncharacterized protein LOC130736966 [Lotus japonicus]